MPEKQEITKEALLQRLEQLEKQNTELKTEIQHPSKVVISPVDMSKMYSDHLMAITIILSAVSFLVVFVGGVFGWIGFKTIQKSITDDFKSMKKSIRTKVDILTSRAIKDIITPLKEEHNAFKKDFIKIKDEAAVIIDKQKEFLEIQEKQEKKLDEFFKQQKKQEKELRLEIAISSADRAYDEQNYKYAVKYLTDALKLSPDDNYLYYKRATSYYNLDKLSEALKDANKSIALSSGSGGDYFVKARILAKAKSSPDEILKTLEKCFEDNPAFVNIYVDHPIFKEVESRQEFKDLVKKYKHT